MKKLRLTILGALFLIALQAVGAKDILYSKADSLIFEAYIKQFATQRDKPVDELIINTAKYFLDKPYVAFTLETSDNEKLVINLREFDCTTFVENCIALSLTLKDGKLSFESYCKNLQGIRYRNGRIDGYTSRLHYTGDWIYENQRRGMIKDMSAGLGGKYHQKDIDFMSTHPQSYKHLKDNEANIGKIKEVEDNINNRNSYVVVPTSSIPSIEKEIRNGDIVAFATSINGLDYSHIGIAYWEKGRLHFIHASTRLKKVIIEEKTLSEYCRGSKSCTGISILRVIDN